MLPTVPTWFALLPAELCSQIASVCCPFDWPTLIAIGMLRIEHDNDANERCFAYDAYLRARLQHEIYSREYDFPCRRFRRLVSRYAVKTRIVLSDDIRVLLCKFLFSCMTGKIGDASSRRAGFYPLLVDLIEFDEAELVQIVASISNAVVYRPGHNQKYETLLECAAANASHKCVRVLLDIGKKKAVRDNKIRQRDKSIDHALIHAVRKAAGAYRCVEMLLDAGADTWTWGHPIRQYPLAYAVRINELEIARLILSKHAPSDIGPDRPYRDAIDTAIEHKNGAALHLLLQHYESYRTSYEKDCMLQTAITKKSMEAVIILAEFILATGTINRCRLNVACIVEDCTGKKDIDSIARAVYQILGSSYS